MPTLTKFPSPHSARPKKMLVLLPRGLFTSAERRSELSHFLSLAAAWKKLVAKGSPIDFTLLSAKHPLDKTASVLSLQRNPMLSELTGMDMDRGVAQIHGQAIGVNFVESSGLGNEELSEFLSDNFDNFGIPSLGWQNWPSTRWLVADSCAIHSAAEQMAKKGNYGGVLAVGWPVFDSALAISRDFSLPAFYKFSTPSRLEADVLGSEASPAVVSREMAALKHGKGILAFDVSQLQWLLSDYPWRELGGEKAVDFENVLEVLNLSTQGEGLRQILELPHAAPSDRRHAIAFLKQVNSTLQSHYVSAGSSFLLSKYSAAFNSALELTTATKQEISAARKKAPHLASLEGTPLSHAGVKRVFSLVASELPNEIVENFCKALSMMPQSGILLRGSSPKMLSQFHEASTAAGVAGRIAPMPERGEVAYLAASQSIAFPNAACNLLHFEPALSAIHSCRQASVPEPFVLATKAAPVLLKDAATLYPAASPERLAGQLLKPFSQASAPKLEEAYKWSWDEAATKLVGFLSERL